MFELTNKELRNLRCQFGTSSWGGIRYNPMVFTEQGVAMLSSILSSKRAIKVNIQIMRTFIKLKKWVLSNDDLKKRMDEMEKKYDAQFKIVFSAIKQLLQPPS